MARLYDHLLLGTNETDSLSDALIPLGQTVLIAGLRGDDVISSFGALNLISGGMGNDTITSFGGTVLGGNGNDIIHMTGARGRIHAGPGDDQIFIDEVGLEPGAVFTIYGEIARPGDDVNTDFGSNTIIGSSAFERFFDGHGDDTVDLKENGIIFARWEADGVPIRDNDIFIGLESSSGSIETVVYGHGVFIRPNPDTGLTEVVRGQDAIDTLIGIDRIIAGNGDSRIFMNSDSHLEVLCGNGDDWIQVGAETGVIKAGRGDDFVWVSGDIDIDAGTGVNSVSFGDGQQTIAFDPDSVRPRETMLTAVERFEPGVDKIRLDPGTDIAAFLASGYEGTYNGIVGPIDGLHFVISPTKSLHFWYLAIDQLSIGDFLV